MLAEPVTLQIRLENDTTSHSGRVGVRYGNSWSSLCYEGLDYPDVKVICRMLGYEDVNHVYAVRTPSSANGRVWLSGVECNGTEASILNCSRTGWWQTTCDFDAVITCKTPGALERLSKMNLGVFSKIKHFLHFVYIIKFPSLD